MGFDGTIDIDSRLLDQMRSLADLNNIEMDDYITLLLEEEILKEITVSFVSGASISK